MYSKALTVKIACRQHRDGPVGHVRRNESPEIRAYVSAELVSLRRHECDKVIQWIEARSFQQVVLGQLDIHMQKDKFRALPHTIDGN